MKELNQEQHIQLLQFMSLLQNCKTEEELQSLKQQYYNIPRFEFMQKYISEKNDKQSFSSYKTSLIYDMDKYQQDYKFVYGENFPAYRKVEIPHTKANYTVLDLMNEINECNNIENYEELLRRDNFPKANIEAISYGFTGIYFADGSNTEREISTISLGIPQIIIKNTPENNFNARKQLVDAGYSLFNLPSIEDVRKNGFDWLHEEISHFKETLNPNFLEHEIKMSQEPEFYENEYEEEAFDGFIEQMNANGGMSAMAAEADYNASYENYEDVDEIQHQMDIDNGLTDENGNEILYDVSEDSIFDKELQEFIDGKLPKSHIFSLGKPSEILVKCGFPAEQRIELSASHLEFKSKLDWHPFDIKDVMGLEEALKNPIAVFEYGNRVKSQNIIVNIEKDGKNFLAGVHFNQSTRGYEVSDIRTLFPKDNIDWLRWIEQGKMIYGNKEKLQALIAQQRINVAEVNSQVAQSPLYEHCLESSTSILDKFGEVKDIFADEYPFYEEIKKKATIEHKFYTYYTEKGNLDARELSVFESEEFYNAIKSGDTEKINEYIKTDLHEINELAAEIYDEYLEKNEIENTQNDSVISQEEFEKYIHSEEFISKFGDWEKASRLQKLSKTPSIIKNGKVIIEGEDVTEEVNNFRNDENNKVLRIFAKEIGRSVKGTYYNDDLNIDVVLVPGDFDHSVTGEKSQKVTRENDQKSHLTPLIIRFPEDCQKQFLPFL